MSKIKYSKKFIVKSFENVERTYAIYRSFHEDYNTFYVWLNRTPVLDELHDPAMHCITFKSDEDEAKFLSIFGENVL